MESAAYAHQAFCWNDQALGLQFHLEMTPESVATLLRAASAELEVARKHSPYVQPVEALLAYAHDAYKPLHRILEQLLDRLFLA